MSDATPQRLNPFEWLRAGAVLGVVLLHACVPYLTHPMRGLAWPVRDTTSRFVNSLFWTIELFIMPLFLVMAGYFAVRLLRARGTTGFVKHRALRLLVPLVVVGAVILPLDLYSWLLGWVVEGHIDFRKLRSLKFEAGMDQNLWGLSHLWFLQYLFLYSVAYALMAKFWPASMQTLSARYLLRRTSLYGLLVVGGIALACAPDVVFGFQHGFLPFASKWFYSGTFFAGGIWLSVYDGELRKTRRLAPRVLFVGAFAAVAAVLSGNQYLSGAGGPALLVLLVACTMVAAWGLTMGTIGLATRYATKSSRIVTYVAAASFWIYLVHHPLIGLVHTDLKILLPNVPPVIKVIVATGITMGWCLASFEVAVRRTALGRMLGVQSAKPAEAAEVESPPTLPMRRAA